MFSFFKRGEAIVLGIDIGSSAIKLVQISKKGNRAILDTYGTISLGPYAGIEIGLAAVARPERITDALLDLIREAKVTAKKAGFAIPISSTLMSRLELPVVPERELQTMVSLEARKYIPVPISEVSLDWSVVPEDRPLTKIPAGDKISPDNNHPADPEFKVPKQEVLIVAVHNDVIAKYRSIVGRAALEVSFLEVELFSVMRSTTDETQGPVMVIDLGASLSKFYIIDHGVLRLSHTINRGAQDITLAIAKTLSIPRSKAEVLKRNIGLINKNKEPRISEIIVIVLDYIFTEANRTIATYQKKHSKKIESIFLVGGGAGLPGVVDFGRARLGADVFLADPFGKLEAPAFLDDVLKKTGPEFAVALGAALRRFKDL